MGLPSPIGVDIYEPGRQPRILAMEAEKRVALDQLIHLAIPMVPPIRRLALPITCKKQSSLLRLRIGNDKVEIFNYALINPPMRLTIYIIIM
jgi:hypothetical protein